MSSTIKKDKGINIRKKVLTRKLKIQKKTSVCILFTKPRNIFLQKCKAIAMKLFSQKNTAMYSERRQNEKKKKDKA